MTIKTIERAYCDAAGCGDSVRVDNLPEGLSDPVPWTVNGDKHYCPDHSDRGETNAETQ